MGWASRRYGLYFHCLTASTADCASMGSPPSTLTLVMSPSLLMVASSWTAPCTCVCKARAGYTGATFLIRSPCDTPCDTRRVCGPGCGTPDGIFIKPEIAWSPECESALTASGAAGSTFSTGVGLGRVGLGVWVSTKTVSSPMVLTTPGCAGGSNEVAFTVDFLGASAMVSVAGEGFCGMTPAGVGVGPGDRKSVV